MKGWNTILPFFGTIAVQWGCIVSKEIELFLIFQLQEPQAAQAWKTLVSPHRMVSTSYTCAQSVTRPLRSIVMVWIPVRPKNLLHCLPVYRTTTLTSTPSDCLIDRTQPDSDVRVNQENFAIPRQVWRSSEGFASTLRVWRLIARILRSPSQIPS